MVCVLRFLKIIANITAIPFATSNDLLHKQKLINNV